ncbi:mediator of RNA polymerase II transcription subunit 13 isoform X2 [Medicago truncatula]|nr:mediator of RNA polymerase II transcription subunit 13-like isoform X2 [Medicago truncatula]
MSRKEDKGKKVASSEPIKKKSKYTIAEEVEPIWARRSQGMVIREPSSDGRPPHRSPSPTYPHTAHSTACPPAHRDTTPSPTIPGVSPSIPGVSFTRVTMSGVNPPLYTHSPRHTTTPISARSPAPSPSIHGVTMSGVNPPLYTHSLRHTTTPISARPPTPSPSINGVSFPRGTVSSVTPPLHTHSPGYNNTHFSARPPTLSSNLLPDVRFLELLGINGGFMPVPEVQQEQEQEQEQEQQQEQQQHCEQEHQSQQQEREAAQQRRVRRRYYEVVPKYKTRYILEIKGDSLEPSKISAKYIREAIQAVYKKLWPMYKDVKKEIGDKVFKEFKIKRNN